MPIHLETFRKHLTYENIATVSAILTDLNEIESIKENAVIKQKRFTSMMIWFILIGIVFLLLAVAINPFVIAVGVGFFIAAIYAGTMRNQSQRLNIPKQRYEILKQVLPMLERDMEKNAEVNVRLVLSPSTQKQKVSKTVPHPRYSNFKIDYYKDEWLKVQGIFLDKTRFLLTATELNQTQYGWKRSSSGKSKYKSKTKSQGLDIGLTLSYPRKQYGAVKVLQNHVREAVQIPELATVKRIKLTDKDVELIVNLFYGYNDQETLYKTITMMFLSLYQVLNLARMLSKK